MDGKAEHDIHQSHEGSIEPAAEITAGDADHRAGSQGGNDGGETGAENGSPAIDDAGEDIAPQLIGAEGVSAEGVAKRFLMFRAIGS